MNLRRPCSHDRYESHYPYLDPSAWCPGGTDIASIAELTPFLADIGYAGVVSVDQAWSVGCGDRYLAGRLTGDRAVEEGRTYLLVACDKIPQGVG